MPGPDPDVTGDRIVDALRSGIAAATAGTTAGGSSPELVAIGWATVELDRAVVELARALGTDPAAFRPASASTVLGASCRIAVRLLDGGIDLAVLEPSTEGRLAAHLARQGEGPTVAWLADTQAFEARGPAGSDGRRDRRGPFGPERILPAGGNDLLRLLVEPSPGTIHP
jgi:hypothetical protein